MVCPRERCFASFCVRVHSHGELLAKRTAIGENQRGTVAGGGIRNGAGDGRQRIRSGVSGALVGRQ